jgi:hypothetical protein
MKYIYIYKKTKKESHLICQTHMCGTYYFGKTQNKRKQNGRNNEKREEYFNPYLRQNGTKSTGKLNLPSFQFNGSGSRAKKLLFFIFSFF